MLFCDELRDLGIIPCRLWVDGSFLTEKVDPDDIDLILEVDQAVYDSLGLDALMFITNIPKQPLHDEPRKLHTFFLKNAPIGHPEHLLYLVFRKQWYYDWGHALLSKQEKGIVILEVGP